MDYRRWCQRAESGLVAAVACLHAAIFFWQEDPSRPNFLLSTAHDAQLLSAIVLTIGWVMLGPGRLWIRLAVSPLLVYIFFLLWHRAMVPRETTVGFVVTFFCAAAVLMGGLRAAGLRIVRRSVADGPERGAQFSLFALLLATTMTAGVIGLLEALRPTLQQVRGFDGWMYSVLSPLPLSSAAEQARQVVMATAVALSALGGLWVVMRPGAIWLRLAMTSVLLLAGGLYLSHLAGADSVFVGLSGRSALFATAASLAIGLGSVAALLGLSVLPLRLMNFRWQRQLRPATQPAARAEDRARLIKRVAAILLLGAAIGIAPFARLLQRRGLGAESIEINGRLTVLWGDRSPLDEMATPLVAFRRWIEPQEFWTDNLSLIIGSGQFVHPQPDVEIELGQITGASDEGGRPQFTTSDGMF